MTDSEHRPKPPSKAARVVMLVFMCMATLGFLLAAAGYIVPAIGILYSAGALFILVGVVGAIVSGIVLIAQPKTAHQQLASWSAGPAAGWYPDPENPAQLRYFDGQVWTASTQPRQ